MTAKTPAAPASPRWLTPGRALGGLLLLFLLLRLLQALTSTHSFDDEEGYTLSAAFELLHHNVWPYQAYQLSDWENGSRLVVWVAAALAWVFGPALFVLKLTGILFSCALLTALFLLVRSVAGTRAGLLAGLLYIFFPEPVFQYSMTAHGFHTDSVFLQLLFFWRLILVVQGARRYRDLLLCGLLGGLAVWFAYISVTLCIAGTALLLVRLFQDKRLPLTRRLAQAGTYLGASLVGALLLLSYNLDNEWSGLKIYDAHSVASYVAPTDLADKISHFARYTLPTFTHFANDRHKGDVEGTLFSVFYWIVALAALCWPLVARLRRRREAGRDAVAARAPGGPWDLAAVVGGTLGVTLFVFLSSKHPVEPWHLVPILIMLLGPLACAMDAAWRGARLVARGAAVAAVAALLAMGVPLNLAQIHPESFGMSLRVDGRHYPLFFHRLWQFYPRLEPVEHVSMHMRWQILPLELEHATEWYTIHPVSFLGDDYYWPLVGELEPDQAITRMLARQPPTREVATNLQILAGFMLCRSAYNGGRPPEEVIGFIARRSREEQGDLMEGLGFCVEARHYRDYIDVAREFKGLAPEGDEETRSRLLGRMVMGMGRGVRVPFLFKYSGFNCATLLPEDLRVPFMEGMGFGHDCRLIGEGIPGAVERQICPALRPAFAQGVKDSAGRCDKVFDLYEKAREGVNPRDPHGEDEPEEPNKEDEPEEPNKEKEQEGSAPTE